MSCSPPTRTDPRGEKKGRFPTRISEGPGTRLLPWRPACRTSGRGMEGFPPTCLPRGDGKGWFPTRTAERGRGLHRGTRTVRCDVDLRWTFGLTGGSTDNEWIVFGV